MKRASFRVAVAAISGALLLVAAGCGASQQQKSTAANADKTAQVEQVCREVGGELKGLPAPTDKDSAVKAQRASAQIFKSASAKLTELERNAGLPDSYKSWVAAFEQLYRYNEQAADAFSEYGLDSERAAQAGQEWEAQASKADGLAQDAGLEGCEVGQAQAG